MPNHPIARKYTVTGHVQGVGYRYFVQKAAERLGISGYAQNLANGDVEVLATGTGAELEELAGYLWKGPSMADVRSVEEMESAACALRGFHVR